MIKPFAIACLAAAAGSGAAMADPAVFVGRIYVTAVTSGCEGTGIGVGVTAQSTLMPKQAGESRTGLTVIYDLSSSVIEPIGGAPLDGSASYVGTGIAEAAFSYEFQGSYVLSQEPPSVNANTKALLLSGKIVNFTGAKGCTATIRGAYSRRP